MKKAEIKSQGGYSLIEILIVLVVVVIIATFAVAMFGASGSNLERQNIARHFKVSLERARFDSVKRRASNCADRSRVEVTSSTSFRLITDLDQNGTITLSSETQTVDYGTRSNVEIVDDSFQAFTIRFDDRGRATSGPCGAETAVDTPTIFCNLPCTAATADAENSNIVFVSPTGTAAFLPGGSSIPTFADPTVATESPSMNPLLAVWDLVTATPTPTPTPPIETPTPDATPEETPTPDPSGTPLPYCEVNERPDNCVCSPTQHLQGGKCRNNH